MLTCGRQRKDLLNVQHDRLNSFLNEEQRKIYDLVIQGNSIFFTGSAGTGKSFLLGRKILTMNQEINHKKIPKLSKEVIDLIKDFPNYYDQHNKIWVFGEPLCTGELTINPNLTEEQKKIIEEKITDESLRERYKLYGLCRECQQPNTWGHEYEQDIWCQACNAKHFQEEFDKNEWTSNNKEIDKFIRSYQQRTINCIQAIEWIPWGRLKIDENFLEEGAFGKVYKVEWSDGYITNWNIKKKKWDRFQQTYFLGNNFFVIKVFKDSRNYPQVIQNMLYEIYYYILLYSSTYRIVRCFGVTQNPETGDYAIVLIHTGETLSSYIEKNKTPNLKAKMKLFNCIASGLNSIHELGLVHRDFHDKNILIANHQNGIYPCIIDFGLCRKEYEKDRGKYYGLPQYLPPEYFKSFQYKRPADVYAFGIIAYFLFTGKFPFREEDCRKWKWEKVKGKVIINKWLKFQENTNLPPLLMDLIKKCCDSNPSERPTSEYLAIITEDWTKDVGGWGEEFVNKDSEFYKQYKEMEEK